MKKDGRVDYNDVISVIASSEKMDGHGTNVLCGAIVALEFSCGQIGRTPTTAAKDVSLDNILILNDRGKEKRRGDENSRLSVLERKLASLEEALEKLVQRE
jgi:hypothetical protein